MSSKKQYSDTTGLVFRILGIVSSIAGMLDLVINLNKPVRKFLGLGATSMTNNIEVWFGLFFIIVGAVIIFRLRPSQENTKKSARLARNSYLAFLKKYIVNRFNNALKQAGFIDLEVSDSSEKIAPLIFIERDFLGKQTITSSLDHLLDPQGFRVLILGAPGSGKTLTLYKYLLEFSRRAIDDEYARIPLYLNLAEWKSPAPLKGDKATSINFESWIAETIAGLKNCTVPEQVAADWLRNQEVCLFIDGLDEAAEPERAELVKYINIFFQERPYIPVIICSRAADYEAMAQAGGAMLHMDHALTIQPYTHEQINDYLEHIKQPELLTMLEHDSALMEMAQSPLELNIMVRAYAHDDFKKLVGQLHHSMIAARFALFELYIRAMVERPPLKQYNKDHSPPGNLLQQQPASLEKELAKVHRYGSWIAQYMTTYGAAFIPGQLYRTLAGDSAQKKETHRLTTLSGWILMIGGVLLSAGLLSIRFPVLPVIGITGTVLIYRFGKAGKYVKKPDWSRIAEIIAGFPLAAALLTAAYTIMEFANSKGFGSPYLLFGPIALFIFTIWFIYARDKNYPTRIKFWSWDIWLPVGLLALPVGMAVFFRGSVLLEWICVYATGLVTGILSFTNYQPQSNNINEYFLAASRIMYMSGAMVIGISFFPPGSLLIMCCFLTIMAGICQSWTDHVPNAVIGVVTGTVITAFCSLFMNTGFLALAGLAIIIGSALLNSFVIKSGFGWFANQITLLDLKFRGDLPWRLKRFLGLGVKQLLFSTDGNHYQFIHRRIRDHFAIRPYFPLLDTADKTQKKDMVWRLLNFKDASCDVLLELVNDDDPQIRRMCVSGLGDIGTATAVNSLIQILQHTIGELYQQAAASIKKIRDIAAVPALVQLANGHPVNSSAFNAAVGALIALHQLPEWTDTEKMSAAVDSRLFTYKEANCLNFELFRRAYVLDPRLLSLEKLVTFDKGCEVLRADIDQFLATLDLNLLLSHKDSQVVVRGLDLLCAIDPQRTLEYLLEHNGYPNGEFSRLPEQSGQRQTLIKAAKLNHKPNLPHYLETCLLLSRWQERLAFTDLRRMVKSDNAATQQQALVHLHRLIPRGSTSEKGNPSVFALILQPAGFAFFTLDIPKLLRSPQAGTRCAAAEVIIRYGYPAPRRLLHLFFSDLANQAQYLRLIYLLMERKPPGTAGLLTMLASNNDHRISGAAMHALGLFKPKSALPVIMQAFQAGHKATMPLLIGALIEYRHPLVMNNMATLYDDHPECRGLIIAKLMKIRSRPQLDELVQQVLKKDIETDLLPRSMLANYCYLYGEHKTALRLVLHPSVFEASRNYRGVIMTEMLLSPQKFLSKTEEAYVGMFNSEQWHNGNNDPGWMFEKVLKKSIARNLQESGIKDEVWDSLHPIFEYDKKLWQWLVNNYLEKGDWNTELVIEPLLEVLTQNSDADHIRLLTALCRLNKTRAFGLLRESFSHLDAGRASMAMHIYLELDPVKDPLIFEPYLSSDEPLVLAQVLQGIRPSDRHYHPPGIYQYIRTRPVFRQMILTEGHHYLLGQLDYQQIELMANNDDHELRYLGLLSFGFSGHARAIGLLKANLGNQTPVAIGSNPFQHSKLSDAALFALEKIGSPDAKRAIDEWQNATS